MEAGEGKERRRIGKSEPTGFTSGNNERDGSHVKLGLGHPINL